MSPHVRDLLNFFRALCAPTWRPSLLTRLTAEEWGQDYSPTVEVAFFAVPTLTKALIVREAAEPERAWDRLERLEGGADGVDLIGDQAFRGETPHPLVRKKPLRSPTASCVLRAGPLIPKPSHPAAESFCWCRTARGDLSFGLVACRAPMSPSSITRRATRTAAMWPLYGPKTCPTDATVCLFAC